MRPIYTHVAPCQGLHGDAMQATANHAKNIEQALSPNDNSSGGSNTHDRTYRTYGRAGNYVFFPSKTQVP